jgi:c-di-GMP-binding flagellar brake protein YcgR
MSGTGNGRVSRASASELTLEMGGRVALGTGKPGEKLQGTLVGVSDNEFLILRLPVMAGLANRYRSGDEVVVRCLSGGCVFGFRTSMLAITMKPAPLMYLEYPYTVEKLDLREHKRVSCALPGRAHTRHGVFPMLVLDLSLGGCMASLEAARQPEAPRCGPGDLVVLETIMADGPGLYAGTVRTARDKCGKRLLGIQFLDLEEPARDAVAQCMDHLLTHM